MNTTEALSWAEHFTLFAHLSFTINPWGTILITQMRNSFRRWRDYPKVIQKMSYSVKNDTHFPVTVKMGRSWLGKGCCISWSSQSFDPSPRPFSKMAWFLPQQRNSGHSHLAKTAINTWIISANVTPLSVTWILGTVATSSCLNWSLCKDLSLTNK